MACSGTADGPLVGRVFGAGPEVDQLEPPLVLKPLAEGSSIGITLCDTVESLKSVLPRAVSDFGRVMLERRLEGPEVTVGILGHDPLPVIQVRPAAGWYDYAAKYERGRHRLPPQPRSRRDDLPERSTIGPEGLRCPRLPRPAANRPDYRSAHGSATARDQHAARISPITAWFPRPPRTSASRFPGSWKCCSKWPGSGVAASSVDQRTQPRARLSPPLSAGLIYDCPERGEIQRT